MANIAQQMMQAAMGRAEGARPKSRSGTTEEDRLAKENRTALRKLFAGAGPKEREALLPVMQKSGIDVEPYKIMEGIVTPEEQAQNVMSQEIMRLFTGQPATPTAPTPQGQPAPAPTKSTEQPPITAEPSQAPSAGPQIFSRDLLTRSAVKKLTGIDVGAHYFEAPSWFEHYGELVQSGIPVEQAVSETAIKFGFIPDGASNLEGLSEIDRNVIFEREFASAFSDETLDATIRRLAPTGTNIDKMKAGLILNTFAEQGRYVPEHYQPLLDRFRNLQNPDFISDKLKTHIYQTTGKSPSDVTPEDVAKAQEELDNKAILDSARKIASDVITRLKAERMIEPEKPVSAEDAAKEGVDVKKFPTYYDIAEAGKRFPTQDERKVYEQMLGAREKLLDLLPLMFGIQFDPLNLEPAKNKQGGFIGDANNGIFIGIKPGWWGKAKGRLSIVRERFLGSQRGQNAEIYEKIMSDIARTLLVISKDMRFSDVDVIQMMKTQGELGTGILDLPDSAPVAYELVKRFLKFNANYLNRMLERTTMEPPVSMPQQETDADDEANNLINQYGGQK